MTTSVTSIRQNSYDYVESRGEEMRVYYVDRITEAKFCFESSTSENALPIHVDFYECDMDGEPVTKVPFEISIHRVAPAMGGLQIDNLVNAFLVETLMADLNQQELDYWNQNELIVPSYKVAFNQIAREKMKRMLDYFGHFYVLKIDLDQELEDPKSEALRFIDKAKEFPSDCDFIYPVSPDSLVDKVISRHNKLPDLAQSKQDMMCVSEIFQKTFAMGGTLVAYS